MMHIGIPPGPPLHSLELPPVYAWRLLKPMEREEWHTVTLPTDEVSGAWVASFCEAQAGSRLQITCLGDPVAILRRPGLYRHGQRCMWNETNRGYRIVFEGRDRTELAMDNNSWWQGRLAQPIEFSRWERAFAEQWLYDNDSDRSRGINSGCGTIQDMMLSTEKHERPPGFQPWITNRERKIVATFVQWLGTNCGRGFLREVARRAGKSISDL